MKPLDPPLAELAARIRAVGAPPTFSGTPAEARARLAAAILADRARSTRPVVGAIEDREAVTDDLRVPIRVYRPVDRDNPCPTLLFFHGGGFVLGSVELMDDIARRLCRDVVAVVVSVEYRLAPEHPFPAAHDDAVAATSWVVANVGTLGGDPGRIALVGESAGGNLAASTTLIMHERRIPIAAQMLIVPGVDMARTLPLPGTCPDYPMLTYADLADITRLYLGSRASDAVHAPPSPLRAASHAGLPPAVIAVAGHDPLREEGLVYATHLTNSGVPVRLHSFDDLFHPFMAFTAVSAAARRASNALCADLACLLSTGTPESDTVRINSAHQRQGRSGTVLHESSCGCGSAVLSELMPSTTADLKDRCGSHAVRRTSSAMPAVRRKRLRRREAGTCWL